jgi:hypothetical protein
VKDAVNEEAQGWDLKRAGGIVRAAKEAALERFEEEARRHGSPARARVGDLAIANCWPYPDSWRICVVTRVDSDGIPTHMRDGAGIRYSDEPTAKGATIMPQYTWIVSRERLAVRAREIAAENGGARFAGVGGARAVFDRAVVWHLKEAS